MGKGKAPADRTEELWSPERVRELLTDRDQLLMRDQIVAQLVSERGGLAGVEVYLRGKHLTAAQRELFEALWAHPGQSYTFYTQLLSLSTSTFYARLRSLSERVTHYLREWSAGVDDATALPPSNLPAPTAALVGRAQAVEALVTLCTSATSRLITLTGPGGIGKTTLALAAGYAARPSFPHGVFLVELAPTSSPQFVLQVLAQTLHIPENRSETLRESTQKYLRDKKMLLILDNFEHVIDAAPLIGQLLAAAPGLHVIVTSREVLRLHSELEYTVQPLDLPRSSRSGAPDLGALAQSAAIQLFLARAQGHSSGLTLTAENAQTIAEICRQLDGLPLAIELAAERCRVLSLEQLLLGLRERFKLLRGRVRDLPSRQQTLWEMVNWSYQMLSDTERQLLEALSSFAGDGGLEALLAVADVGLELDALSTLVEKSLIQRTLLPNGQIRFGMLETIRSFVLAHLVPDEQAALARAHTRHFLQLAEQIEPHLTGPTMKEHLDRLEAEHHNLQAALRWAIAQQERTFAFGLTAALWRFWYARSYLSEGMASLEATLQLRSEGIALIPLSKTLLGLGVLCWQRGLGERSIALLEEALGLAEQAGDLALQATTTNFLAAATSNFVSPALALPLLERTLALWEQARNEWGIATCLSNLGLLFLEDDPPRAVGYFERARVLHSAQGNSYGVAVACSNIGQVQITLGDYAGSVANYRTSLEIMSELRYMSNALMGANNLAEALIGLGRPDTALCLYSAVSAAREQLGLQLSPSEVEATSQPFQSLRDTLGPQRWDTAWMRGQQLTFDDLVALALSTADEIQAPPHH